MSQVQTGRHTVSNDQDIVVFLIGARINRWWLLPLSLPILSKMNKMLRELQQDPESGLLAVQPVGFGATVQYWKSYDHLDRYANDPKKVHRPTWTAYFARLFKNYAAGIWHETYVVRAGEYEAIYTNMPRRGLGLFKPLIAAHGVHTTSASRLGRGQA
jgi:hypothetical protein